MKYLKKFETQAAYDAAKDGLILPNVSLIDADGHVEYEPYVEPPVVHDYVEIGGKKWATMNIGAESVTDAGLYFQWGDTQGYTASQCGSGEGQKYFGWADYKYYNGTNPNYITSADMTKYDLTDNKITLDASDDAATATWGGNWRMPTSAECYSLFITNTNISYVTSYQGVSVTGFVLTDKTDSTKTLFFPSGGNCSNGNDLYKTSGYYWTSSLCTNQLTEEYLKCNALQVYLSYLGGTAYANWAHETIRPQGCLIRPILDE